MKNMVLSIHVTESIPHGRTPHSLSTKMIPKKIPIHAINWVNDQFSSLGTFKLFQYLYRVCTHLSKCLHYMSVAEWISRRWWQSLLEANFLFTAESFLTCLWERMLTGLFRLILAGFLRNCAERASETNHVYHITSPSFAPSMAVFDGYGVTRASPFFGMFHHFLNALQSRLQWSISKCVLYTVSWGIVNYTASSLPKGVLLLLRNNKKDIFVISSSECINIF